MKNLQHKTQIKADLSAEELWYLLNLYAPTSVIGIENPYMGRLVEEIEIFEEFALQSLLSRQILRLNEENTLEFSDAPAKRMIETCLKPERCLWLTASQGNQEKITAQRWIYITDSRIVDVFCEGDRSYTLTELHSPGELVEMITPFLSPDGEDRAASSDFVLPQAVLDAVIQAFDAGDPQSGRAALSAAGIGETAAEELSSVLGEEGHTLLAILICNPSHPEQCHTREVGYMRGTQGGWILKQTTQSGKEAMHFQPETSAGFRELAFTLAQ